MFLALKPHAGRLHRPQTNQFPYKAVFSEPAWYEGKPWPGTSRTGEAVTLRMMMGTHLRGDRSNASHFLQEDRYSSLSSGIRLRLGWVMPLRCSACTFRNWSSRFVFVCGCNVTPPSSPYNGKIIVLKIRLVSVVPFSLCFLGEFYLLLRSFLWRDSWPSWRSWRSPHPCH